MDLTNMKQSARILQELLEGTYNFSPSSEKANFARSNDGKNNNGSVTCESTKSLSGFDPNNYCFVILDSDVEGILQKMSDGFFHVCFNFDKMMVRCLLLELHQRTYYHPLDDINSGLSFDMSVLVTLSYLTNGHCDYLILSSEFMGFSSAVLHRCVEKMSQIIVYFLSPVYVKFPCSPEEQEANKSAFLGQFGVPGVLGVLDLFNVGLQNVPEHEKPMYLNRRCQWPSLAVQVICDQNYRFLDVNPRFSGSTHNIHIWRRSHINGILQSSQEINPKTWLIADRGYNLSSCVVNPYRNASDLQQESVNVALQEIQNVALKSFALLKARFRCLNTILPFTHVNATNIITACATLHNYLLAKEQPIEANLSSYQVPKEKNLPNARFEDAFSPQGMANREFIKDFMYTNSMQVLYRMRKNSNLSFLSDSDQITTC